MERLLRILQRLEFREVTVLSNSLPAIREHLKQPSWARAELQISFREYDATGAPDVGELVRQYSARSERSLLLRGDFFCDARLLAALAEAETTTVLIDSQPPAELEPLWRDLPISQGGRSSGAILMTLDWLSRQDRARPWIWEGDDIAVIDAAEFPDYLRDQRAHVRPVFFPAPSSQLSRVAEHVIQHAAQKGTLDIPAMAHAPIETWLVSKLWRTPIRPNHLSAITMLVGLTVTALYASGRLSLGVGIALAVGVLDGLDGKLARTKVETTTLGKWEHDADYVVETTWWLALAYHFAIAKTVPHAWLLWAALFSCEAADRATRGWIKKRLDRNLDDVTAFDRLLRLVGARRNIYTWILAIGLSLGAGANAFVVICWWGIGTAAIHVLRALQIRRAAPASVKINR